MIVLVACCFDITLIFFADLPSSGWNYIVRIFLYKAVCETTSMHELL